jgi:hypothetical protein
MAGSHRWNIRAASRFVESMRGFKQLMFDSASTWRAALAAVARR